MFSLRNCDTRLDFNGAVNAKVTETETNIKAWRGTTPSEPVDADS